jgi:hypothetical protein
MAGESTLSTYDAQLVFAWTVIFLVLALLATLGRLYSRYLKGTRYGFDDYLIVGGTVVYYIQGVLVFIGTLHLLILLLLHKIIITNRHAAIFHGGVGHLVSNLENPAQKLATLFKVCSYLQYLQSLLV